MKKLKTLAARGAVGAAVGAASVAHAQVAAAAGPDFTQLTGAISMDSTATAVLAVAAMVITVVLAVAGAKVVIRMVKGV
ncbi:membrane protein [Caballeronia grimmiae]|uniref:Membrane protein n=1 Tax=Caballeronia grimmiae TaxID=1071679 RepID=A0A069N9X6_9BURK|nr:membrane protein [Caballeronia grimmiae]